MTKTPVAAAQQLLVGPLRADGSPLQANKGACVKYNYNGTSTKTQEIAYQRFPLLSADGGGQQVQGRSVVSKSCHLERKWASI